jgi:hypothetical protein
MANLTINEEEEINNEDVDFLKNHIKSLCNFDENIFTYVLNWLATFFQFPKKKLTMLHFISQEGIGKGMLVEIMNKMIGVNKVLITANPEEIFGRFNSIMIDKYFVVLNECCISKIAQYDTQLMSLVTDIKLTINTKFGQPFVYDSYAKFWAYANTNTTTLPKENSRRDVYIRCSDVNIGNVEYFRKLRDIPESAIYGLYKFLMERDVSSWNHEVSIPKTEYMTEVIDAYRPIEDDFFRSHVVQKIKLGTRTENVTAAELYKLFLTWKEDNHINRDVTHITPKKFMLNITLKYGNNKEAYGDGRDNHQRYKKLNYPLLCQMMKININSPETSAAPPPKTSAAVAPPTPPETSHPPPEMIHPPTHSTKRGRTEQEIEEDNYHKIPRLDEE